MFVQLIIIITVVKKVCCNKHFLFLGVLLWEHFQSIISIQHVPRAVQHNWSGNRILQNRLILEQLNRDQAFTKHMYFDRTAEHWRGFHKTDLTETTEQGTGFLKTGGTWNSWTENRFSQNNSIQFKKNVLRYHNCTAIHRKTSFFFFTNFLFRFTY